MDFIQYQEKASGGRAKEKEERPRPHDYNRRSNLPRVPLLAYLRAHCNLQPRGGSRDGMGRMGRMGRMGTSLCWRRPIPAAEPLSSARRDAAACADQGGECRVARGIQSEGLCPGGQCCSRREGPRRPCIGRSGRIEQPMAGVHREHARPGSSARAAVQHLVEPVSPCHFLSLHLS